MRRIRLLIALFLCAGPAAVTSHTPVSPDHPTAARLPLPGHPVPTTVPGVPANWNMLLKNDPATIRRGICQMLRGADQAPQRHRCFEPAQILLELQARGMCKGDAS